MIDSHCHLNFKAFSSDWREVASRAFLGGVESIINVGSNLETSRRAIELADAMPGELFAAIALHPIHINDEEFGIARYEELITDNCQCERKRGNLTHQSHPERAKRVEGSLSTCHLSPATCHSPVVAIGETGIDLYHSPDNLDAQRDAFIQFIDLANKHHLPIIVHNRNAGDEVLDVLTNHKPRFGGVMHFFSEDWDYARELIDLGLLISFTGAITLKNIDAKTIDVIKKAPLSKIMIETDAPFVVPEPMKSQGVERNEPQYIVEVAKRFAEIKKVDVDKVAHQTTQNTINLFNL